MRVNYKGMNSEYNYRMAEISYTEKEENLMKRIEKVMNIHGWNLNIITDGYASCEVNDKDEYNDFVRDYKDVKKSVKLWEKFGF